MLPITLALGLVLVMWPIVTLFSLGGADWSIVSQAYFQRVFAWTLLQTLATNATTTVVGIPFAWLLAHYRFPGRHLFSGFLLLPMVVPSLTLAVVLRDVGMPWGMLLGNMFFNLALVVLFTWYGLSAVEKEVVDSGQNLGASAWQVFWRLEWPALRPWLWAANGLVFLYCVNSFVLPLLLGGNDYATVAVVVYRLLAQQLNFAEAIPLTSLFLLAVFLLLVPYWRLSGNGPVWMQQEGRAGLRHGGKPAPFFLSLTIYAFFALWLCPIWVLLWQAMRGPLWQQMWAPEVVDALRNTLILAAVTLTLVFAWGVAMTRQRPSSRLEKTCYYIVFSLPLALPPIFLGLGLVLAYPAWTGHIGLLLALYVLFALPSLFFALERAWAGLSRSDTECALTLGTGPWQRWYRLDLPQLLPALWGGVGFAAAGFFGEFAGNLLLSNADWITLPKLLYQYLAYPGRGQAGAVVGLELLTLALVFFAGLMWLARRPAWGADRV